MHASSTKPQRGAKMQPGGSWSTRGIEPGMVTSERFCGVGSKCGTQPSRSSVYGCSGRLKSSFSSACSMNSPAYITPTRSQILVITPRSWVMYRIAESNSRLSSATRSRTTAWVVTSRAVVGSSMMSSDGLVMSAMAMTQRCSMPPESWCG